MGEGVSYRFKTARELVFFDGMVDGEQTWKKLPAGTVLLSVNPQGSDRKYVFDQNRKMGRKLIVAKVDGLIRFFDLGDLIGLE